MILVSALRLSEVKILKRTGRAPSGTDADGHRLRVRWLGRCWWAPGSKRVPRGTWRLRTVRSPFRGVTKDWAIFRDLCCRSREECGIGERDNGVPARTGKGHAHLLEEAGPRGVGRPADVGTRLCRQSCLAAGEVSLIRANREVPARRELRAPVIPILGRGSCKTRRSKSSSTV